MEYMGDCCTDLVCLVMECMGDCSRSAILGDFSLLPLSLSGWTDKPLVVDDLCLIFLGVPLWDAGTFEFYVM